MGRGSAKTLQKSELNKQLLKLDSNNKLVIMQMDPYVKINHLEQHPDGCYTLTPSVTLKTCNELRVKIKLLNLFTKARECIDR